MELQNLLNLLTDSPLRLSQPSVYEPTAPSVGPPQAADQVDGDADTYLPGSQPDIPADSGLQQLPDGTYYRREASLSYRLDLRFDLGAFLATAESLAEGDVSAANAFMAEFGLKADFALKGFETVTSNDPSVVDEHPSTTVTNGKHLGHQKARAKLAALYADSDRALSVRGFYRQASRVRESLHETVHEGHRRATRRLAWRFQADTRFQTSLLERFNVQTKQLADTTPGAVGDYVDSTDRLAAGGSTDLLASFFNAVEAYLAQSEERITGQVTQFFNRAAAELGFDGALVESARTDLLNSIESFFGRVESALNITSGTLIGPEAPEPEAVDVTAVQGRVTIDA
jgi:hypothetical protein